MAKVVNIRSNQQLDDLLQSSKFVIADFWAQWCGPCKMIAPFFASMAERFSQENFVTFAKIDTEAVPAVASAYEITSLPTFILFRDGQILERTVGANPKTFESIIGRMSREVARGGVPAAASGASGSGSGPGPSSERWLGAPLPRGYTDITDQIEVGLCELLNINPDAGSLRVLFDGAKPRGDSAKDRVVSDTDEQVMFFIPFMAKVKLHTLQITSLPDESDDVARPVTIKLYSNSPHNLGFDEAEDTQATQEITIQPSDWNAEGTASIPLRFVKFQQLTSLVIFVVTAEDGAEKVRLDRVRLIGEAGEKREMGKLEKIGDEIGE